jgi:hypothetical protein
MKKLISTFLFTLSFLVPISGTVVNAQFDPLSKTCESGQIDGSGQEICDKSANPTDPTSNDNGLFVTAANVLSIIAGVIAVVIIIISGIKMMLSGGDPGKITSSRNAIIYTVVGLFVVIASRTIVVFIFQRLQG